jgi:heterodisulfide reductase subunit C
MSRPDFGFSWSGARALDPSQPLGSEVQKVLDGEPGLLDCISCGQCAAVCTAGAYTSMSFYRVVLHLLRGETKEASMMSHGCMLCGKCRMTCPRGVNIHNAVMLISALMHTKA